MDADGNKGAVPGRSRNIIRGTAAFVKKSSDKFAANVYRSIIARC